MKINKLLLFALILLSGCTAIKFLNSSFKLIETDKVLSIKPGVTKSEEVKEFFGEPAKNKNNEYTYLYSKLDALKDEVYLQELHVYFENDIVKETTFVNIIKGAGTYNPSKIYDSLSSLKIENTVSCARLNISFTAKIA